MSEAAASPSRPASRSRQRQHALRVYVLPDERSRIAASAERAGLSVANYLRALGLGYEPPSAVDYQAVRDLAKVAGDQGRLGGLLKQWLATKPGEGASEFDVSRLLDELLLLQAELRERVRSL